MSNPYPPKVGRVVEFRATHPGGNVGMTLRPAIVTGGIPTAITVTASSRSGNVVVLTAANTLTTGSRVAVNLLDNSYDGLFIIDSRTDTTITYTQIGADAATTTGTIQDIDTCDVRVGHHGETYSGIVRRTGNRGTNNTGWNNHWMPP